MKKLGLLLLAICFLLVTGCGSQTANEKFLDEHKNTKTPPYREVSESLSRDRVSLLAIVDDKISKEDMQKIATKAVAGAIKANPKIYGVYVSVTDSDIKGIPVNLGQYEYGPDGDAGYDPKKIDSPKTLTNKVERLNRDWSQKPTERDYKIYTLYMAYLRKNSNGSVSGFLNQFSGDKPSAKEVEDSVKKVEMWIMS